jgi:hypothetical protein
MERRKRKVSGWRAVDGSGGYVEGIIFSLFGILTHSQTPPSLPYPPYSPLSTLFK